MEDFGVSFSIKQCRNFDIPADDCLKWLIKCGFRHFRLMSYWDEIEKFDGKYDFQELDRQFGIIAKHGGSVSLCLGVRQPRWPENHWPDWVLKISKAERTEALLEFIKSVIERYKKYPCLISYQLENEALLKSFGEKSEIDRRRLKQEFDLVKKLDPSRPIIMSTSTSWGIPLRKPIPDVVGLSYYQVLYNDKKNDYTTAFHRPWLHLIRARLIKNIWKRPAFIHELQLEPWGPKAIWEMSMSDQVRSMSLAQIKNNIELTKKTVLFPIYLWGGEWWYWCDKHGNKEIINTVLRAVSTAK